MKIEISNFQRDILLAALNYHLNCANEAIAAYRARLDAARLMGKCDSSSVQGGERYVRTLERDIDATKTLIKQLEEGKTQ